MSYSDAGVDFERDDIGAALKKAGSQAVQLWAASMLEVLTRHGMDRTLLYRNETCATLSDQPWPVGEELYR